MLGRVNNTVNFMKYARCEGASAGTPGTLPTGWYFYSGNPAAGVQTNVIGTGTEGGIPYIDLAWAGTANATTAPALVLDNDTTVPAKLGQTWTFSAFLKLQSGSLNGATMALQITEWNNIGSILAATNQQFVIGSTSLPNNLHSFTYTTKNAACAYVNGALVFGYTNLATYSFTLRFGPGWLTPGYQRGFLALPPVGSPGFSQITR